MLKKLTLFQIFFLCVLTVRAQQIVLMGSTSSVTTCNALFYDSGGQSGNYGNNQNQTITFYPQAAGQRIQLQFNQFTFNFNDILSIYDGTSTSDPLIFTGTFQSPGFVLASNPAGAITVQFVSNASSTSPGWSAIVECVDPSYQHFTIGTIPSITTCGSLLFDAGGPMNDSGGNNDDTLTIYPAVSGNKIVLDFSNNLYNYFKFFDGPNTNNPLPYSQVSANITQVRSTHPTGAITMVTVGSYNQNWHCNISCQSPGIIPDCTTLGYPADNSTNQTNLPVLQWNNFGAGTPETYDVYFGTNPNPPLVSSSQTENYYFTGELSLATTYYWKVISKNQSGNSGSCSTFQFTTSTYDYSTVFANQTVGFCNTQVNVSNQNKYSQNGSLTLNPIAGTQAGVTFNFYNGYLAPNDSLFVYNGNSIQSPVLGIYTQSNIGSVSSFTDVSTSFDGRITIRLKSAFSYQLSNFSFLTFCVDPNTSPGCVNLISPADGSFDIFPNTQLIWEANLSGGGAPDAYDVYLGTTPGTTLVSSNQTDTFYNATNLQLNTTYYWEIIPKNQFGETFGCSYGSFTTVSVVPFLDLFPYGGNVIQGDGINVDYDGAGVSEINFSYSSDGGSTYIPFAFNEPFNNSYVWVPIPPAGSVIIRGEDANNPAVWDTIQIYVTSLDLFIASPQSYEEYLQGNDFWINWLSNEQITFGDFNNVLVEIKEDQGQWMDFFLYDSGVIPTDNFISHYDAIAQGYLSGQPLPSGSYTLSVTPTYGNNYTTQTPFFIKDFILTTPNAFDFFVAGQIITINGQSYLSDTYILEFSSDNGNTWSIITNSYPNTGGIYYAYNWIAPNIGSSNCLIRVKNSLGEVLDETNGTFTIQCNATANITANGPTSFCAGGNVQLSASTGTGYTYQWKQNGNDISGATSPSYLATASGNYSVVVTANGCTATSTFIIVTVNPAPTASTITANGPTTFCSGGSVSLNVPTQTGVNYQWKRNGNNVGSNNNSYNANQAGTYTVELSNSCGTVVSTNSITVTINQAPTASTITPNGPTTFCLGGSVSLSVPTQTGVNYQWKRNGNNVGSNNNSFSANQAGTYSVELSNSCGTVVSANSITVTINQAPTATSITANGPTTFCSGGTVSLSVPTQTGVTYQWKLNGNNVGSNNNSFTANQAGTYTVELSNSCGTVVSTNSITVTINQAPTASTITPNGPTTFCSGGSVSLSVPTQTGVTYQWKLNGNNVGSNNNSFTANQAGTYTLELSNGCGTIVSANSIMVVVNPLPTATISAAGSTNICQGDVVTLNASAGAGYTYQWNNNGVPVNGAQNISYDAMTAGNYSVTVTDANCSSTSGILAVTVNANPNTNVNVGGPLSFCQGGSVVLTANANSNYSYQWLLNGGIISGANAQQYTATQTGNYSVSITENNCNATSAEYTVQAVANPTAQITPNGTTTFCEGGNVLLQASTGSNYTYQWLINGVNIPGANNPTYNAENDGNYSVFISNSFGCTNSSSGITVDEILNTAILSQPINQVACVGSNVSFGINAVGENLNLQWYFNGNPISGADQTILTLNNIGPGNQGNYYIEVSGDCGLLNSTQVTLTVTGSLSISQQPSDTSLCEGSDYLIEVVANGSNTTYQWYFNNQAINGANASALNLLNVQQSDAGNYYVEITSGCGNATSNIAGIVVNTIPAPQLTLTGDSVLCQGESTQLSTGSFNSFQWYNNGVAIPGETQNNLVVNQSGNYFVEVVQNACSNSSAVQNITVNPNPVPPALNYLPGLTACDGDTIWVSSSYNNNNLWSTGENSNQILVTGDAIINCTYTDANGCSAVSQDLNLQFQPLPVIPIISINGSSLESSYQNGNQWYINGLLQPADTNQMISAGFPGTYVVCYTNANNCSACSLPFLVTSILNESINPIISIYPNPAHDFIMIHTEGWSNPQEILIKLLSIEGRLIHQEKLIQQSGKLELPNTPPGLYLIEISQNNRVMARQKIMFR